jgi:hypothetical protein
LSDERYRALVVEHEVVERLWTARPRPSAPFWSLTMYDERSSSLRNAIAQYAIGDPDNLAFNPDGSLDLYIQRGSPGKDKESNWLPTPKSGLFTMNLRLYWPKAEVLDGSCVDY